MRILPVAALVVVGALCVTLPAQANEYSVRDLGFVETGPRPYSLVMFHDASTALDARLAEIALAKELSHTNVALVVVPLEQRNAHPEYDRIKLPPKLTQPLYWLVGPGDRASAIDPAVAKGTLFNSRLRDELLNDVTESLCILVLLDSTDASANEKAKTRASKVLAQINKVRAKLDKAPAGEIKLRVLPTAGREEERWTLWSLGQEEIAPTEPKLAVIFGNLRRAGALLNGTEWDETELFSRIAGLGQFSDSWDNDYFRASPLVHRTPLAWQDKLSKVLAFNPHDDKIKQEAKALLTQPLEKIAPRKRWTLEDFGEAKEPDPFHFPDENPPFVAPVPVPIVQGVPAMSSREMTTAILIGGIAGWIMLAVTVWILERRSEA